MCRIYYNRLKDDDTAKEILNNGAKGNAPPKTYDCYSEYNMYYNGKSEDGGNIYFGFYSDRRIKKLANIFNKEFKNIKVKILGVRNFTFKSEIGFHGKESTGRYSGVTYPNKVPWTIFRVELDEKYSQKANYVLTLVIAQFFRIYCPEYTHYARIVDKEVTLQNVIDAFNSYIKNDWYGCWTSNYKSTMKFLKELDDIDLINKQASKFSLEMMPYVSTLLNNIDRQVVEW